MIRGKLLDNDTQLFIFISILIMTQLHPNDPENRQQNPELGTALLGKKKYSYNWLNGKAWLGLLPVRILSGNNAEFVSVDLIGERIKSYKNMVLRIGRSFLVTSRNVKEKMFLKL